MPVLQPSISPPGDAAEKVAHEILAYLARRPNACDTLDGILQWWLPRIRLEEATETVEQALVLLERRDLVDRVPVPAGEVLYCRRDRDAASTAGEGT
ncbi:MAG TPA: hypothetical protein VLK85_34845 [Ramlibacter sp.]|nr:hypothetical protein [Ramlibacter sp.]